MLTFISYLCIFVFLFCILMEIRVKIIYMHRYKALSVTSTKAKRALDEGREWRVYYDMKEQFGSYDEMMWQLHKWTYKQFYPNWEV